MKYNVSYTELLGRTFIVDADSEEEAATKIAEEIINYYGIDIDIDDFIKEERQCDNGDFRYDDDADNHVWFNNYECSCYGQNMEDSWLIIEV